MIASPKSSWISPTGAPDRQDWVHPRAPLIAPTFALIACVILEASGKRCSRRGSLRFGTGFPKRLEMRHGGYEPAMEDGSKKIEGEMGKLKVDGIEVIVAPAPAY
jgi:hypothetical protein